MYAATIFSGSGPLVILTSHGGVVDPDLLERLARKGIYKFIAFPIPVDVAKAKYGVHFDVVCQSLDETDNLDMKWLADQDREEAAVTAVG